MSKKSNISTRGYRSPSTSPPRKRLRLSNAAELPTKRKDAHTDTKANHCSSSQPFANSYPGAEEDHPAFVDLVKLILLELDALETLLKEA